MQIAPLGFCSFFKTYINDTQNENLSLRDRRIALLTSVIIGVLLAAIPHLISLFCSLKNRCSKNPLPHSETVNRVATPLLTPIVPQSKPKLQPQSYNELMRRVTPQERKELDTALAAIPVETVNKLVDTFTNHPWEHADIYKNPNHVLVALKAVAMGLLTCEDFATVCLFAASIPRHRESQLIYNKPALTSSPVQISLFNNDGTRNEDAVKIIEETIMAYDNDKWLSAAQMDAFFDKMQKLPKSAQQFLVIGDSDQFGGGGICSSIYSHSRFQVLGCFVDHQTIPIPVIRDITKESAGKLRLIPSGGMMQTLLEVIGRAPLVKANFVLGQTTEKENSDNPGVYSLHIPLKPWVSVKEIIHSRDAKDIDNTYYDFYTSVVESLIPANHRTLIDKVIKLPSMISKNMSSTIIMGLAKDLYLFDNPHHLERLLAIPKDSDMAFWLFLSQVLEVIDRDYPKSDECLLDVVDRFAIKEEGASQGVRAKGLFDLVEKMEEVRDDLNSKMKKANRHEKITLTAHFRRICDSPIWRMVSQYQKMK